MVKRRRRRTQRWMWLRRIDWNPWTVVGTSAVVIAALALMFATYVSETRTTSTGDTAASSLWVGHETTAFTRLADTA